MLSSASKYAIRIIIYLAQNKKDGKIGGKCIAENLGLASPFVGKVLQPLAHSGIVKSTKGPHGGFVLNLEPEEISLLNIIQIFEGEDAFKACLLHACNCQTYETENNKTCLIHDDIAPARKQFFESLKNKTIADILTFNTQENLSPLSDILGKIPFQPQ